MKLIPLAVLLAALMVVASGYVRPKRCDYKCTNHDETVCAGNEVCINRFPSRCLLEKYNCLFPQKAFRVVGDFKCLQSASPTYRKYVTPQSLIPSGSPEQHIHHLRAIKKQLRNGLQSRQNCVKCLKQQP